MARSRDVFGQGLSLAARIKIRVPKLKRRPRRNLRARSEPLLPPVAPDGSLTLRATLWQSRWLFALIPLLGLASYWMFEEGRWFTGLIGVGFTVLVALFAMMRVLPQGSCLRLTVEGFEARTLFRRFSVRWAEVAGFYVFELSRHRLWSHEVVAWDWGGERDWLPEHYGMKPAALAALMNVWRARAVSQPR